MQEIKADDERDINDVFTDLLLIEDTIVKNSYQEGFELGKSQGNPEAFHLGYHRGAELGAEIGYYTSITETYLNFYERINNKDSDKFIKELTSLKTLLASFPNYNDPNVDILQLIELIRARFKKKMCNSITVIKKQIDNLLCFLQPFLNLANCHMVDFFTDSVYTNALPELIQNEIQNIGENKVIDLIFKNEFNEAPNIQQFVENSSKFTLKNCPNVCLTVDDFMNKVQNWGCDNIEKFKLEIFMTAKKSHEVEILSAVAKSVSQIADITHLVDIGDGKGYLSSMLALHHGIPILGVDASNINTCGAVKRATKLSKVWKGVAKAPNKSYPSKSDNTSSENINLYKQVTRFVDEDFRLQELISDIYAVESSTLRLGVVGLHTCGNLAPSSLKIFAKNDYIKSVCNVGCCYHLLSEKFGKNPSFGETTSAGFPLSQYLTDRKTSIGRSARMIANQSVDRILDAKELPSISIFYRALLQVLLEQYCTILPTKHVGKFRKEPPNFLEYARMAMKRLDVNITISDEKIEEFASIYQNRINELNIFYLLRCKLSSVIESLILLDRLLFLHEQGFENSFVIQFFDPVVSPRCYGIVSIKEISCK